MSTALPLPLQRGLSLAVVLALVLAAMVPLVVPRAARAAVADTVINEFSASTAGEDVEYLEVVGDSSTDLSSLTILEIEGDGAGAGVVDEVVTVGTTDADGRWHTDLPANAIENGTITLLLVSDFSGSLGDDLDTDNDGSFDLTPWTAVLDAVAVSDGGTGDRTYGLPVLASGYDGVDFVPGGASRIPDGHDTDTADDWVRNDFDLAGIPGFDGTPDEGEALNTPGAANALVEPDTTPAGAVVISEFYGGGGNDGATYDRDFVELKNVTDEPIAVDGWSVQHASATGTSWGVTALSGTIQPGGTYLVALGSGTSGEGAPLPTPDAQGTRNIGTASGKLAVVTGSTALTGGCPTDVVDLVGYGTTADCFEGSGPAPAHSNTTSTFRLGDGSQDTNDNATDFSTGVPTPQNSGITPPDPCVEGATPIHDVQGTGLTSPLAGQVVTVQGAVVGDFQNNASPDDGDLGLFFVQEEDDDADADPLTSEGIAVFGSSPDVAVGDLVRVTGTVVEFGSNGTITELSSVTEVHVCAHDAALPTPAAPTLPVTDPADFERWEAMLVTFPQELTISEFFNYDRFGEMVLTVDRDHQPTAVFDPDTPERAALADENLRNRITLDDGLTAQNPPVLRHPNGDPFSLDNRFRGGDTVTNVTGVIDHSFGLYRVQPTEGADYAAANPRPASPNDVGGRLTVASFNVLNYFTTLTTEGAVCGPNQDQDCRGADDELELERQQAKIVAALAAIDADIVGLIEIENHPGDVPTATLVEALNAVVGPGTYDYVPTGAIGTDAIRVAMIYKPATVTPAGDFAILDSSVDPRFNDDHNRPVLAQAFEENATGASFTVAVNHLKSKGSDCGGPPDDDPVQGNCNLTRLAAAEALVDWLATDPTGSGDLDALIIGDLNSYDHEDPIAAIRDAGYTDLVAASEGELAYSYLFDGQLGYLDHALASPTMVGQVTGATVWHINADEPDVLDYDMSFKPPEQEALFAPDAYRSSDHDPVVVGLAPTYGFAGFEPPLGESNDARAGRAIPVKFSLDDEPGLDLLSEPPQVFACGDVPNGPSFDAASAGGAGLTYDPVEDQYVFVWKTSASWAGSCKALAFTFLDGTVQFVEVDFH